MSPRFETRHPAAICISICSADRHRLYVEEAGTGIPLLCLHTAGSDAAAISWPAQRPRITRDYRVIVFDMPWHGKSSPPLGWQDEEYRLTLGDDYVRMILEISAARWSSTGRTV